MNTNAFMTSAPIVLMLIIIAHRYVTANQFKLGTCISTKNTSEQTKITIWDKLLIREKKQNATRCVQAYYKEEKGKKIRKDEAQRIIQDFINEIIEMVNRKYPDNGFYDEPREVFLASNEKKRKKAAKDFNGMAWTHGSVEITYAYYELWQSSAYEQDIKEDLIANVLMHEAGHHVFSVYTGFHLFHRRKRMYISYINECFADIYSFSKMNKTPEEAADILRFKYNKVKKVKNNHRWSQTHPSNMYRIYSLRKGVCGDTLQDIADYINEIKGKDYIKREMVVETAARIHSYETHNDMKLGMRLRCDKA